jgi:hypothetical protein
MTKELEPIELRFILAILQFRKDVIKDLSVKLTNPQKTEINFIDKLQDKIEVIHSKQCEIEELKKVDQGIAEWHKEIWGVKK